MNNRITFSIDKDDDTLVLCISVSYFDFSGKGCCYFNKNDLEDKLKAFECYPLKCDVGACIEGGYYSDDMRFLRETHLHLSVRQIDLRGGVGMKIILSTPLDEGHVFLVKSDFDIRIDYEKTKEIVGSIKYAIDHGVAEVLL